MFLYCVLFVVFIIVQILFNFGVFVVLFVDCIYGYWYMYYWSCVISFFGCGYYGIYFVEMNLRLFVVDLYCILLDFVFCFLIGVVSLWLCYVDVCVCFEI